MLKRCADTTDKHYRIYGALGVRVDESWYNFTNFYYDAIYLPNYDKKLKYPDYYELDKDYLQFNIPKEQKIYSKNTCIWLSINDNDMVRFMKTSPNNYVGVMRLYSRGKDTFGGISYTVDIKGIEYGRFKTIEEAANLFNYLYPKLMEQFDDIVFQNQVPYIIPFDELMKNNLSPSKENIARIYTVMNS